MRTSWRENPFTVEPLGNPFRRYSFREPPEYAADNLGLLLNDFQLAGLALDRAISIRLPAGVFPDCYFPRLSAPRLVGEVFEVERAEETAHAQLIGPTDKPEVWEELTELLLRPYDGLHIERALVDSGFRPGKPGAGDDHAVYEYVRTLPWLVYPAKGHAQRAMPISDARIEVTSKGQRAKRSMILLHIDSDFFKSLVHSRLRAVDGAPGAIYLPEDATDDYCQQLVSEWRAISPDNSKAYWIVRNRRIHFLDCCALAAAAGYMLKVHTFPDGVRREPGPDAVTPDDGGETQELRASLRKKFAAHARRRTQR